MPILDGERDKRFKKDVEKGFSIRELSEKYGIGRRQVSRLKGKFKEKKATRRPVTKETATRRPVTKETATRRRVSEATEKMAFWLDRDIKEKLKIEAVKEKRTASDVVRELLRKYLKNK